MNTRRIYTLFLLFSLACLAYSQKSRELQATSITITATRSTQLYGRCTNNNRASLYSQYGLSDNLQYKTDF
jgi:hypothetical protein